MSIRLPSSRRKPSTPFNNLSPRQTLGVALVGAASLWFSFCSSNKKREEADQARMGTLHGRAWLAAENSFGDDNVLKVELMPQADGGERIHITFKGYFGFSEESGRQLAMSDIEEFFARFYSYQQPSDVSSFWFSPQAALTDKYGKTSEENVGKLVIDRAVTDKISDWSNLRVGALESIFADEGTLWWHPAVSD